MFFRQYLPLFFLAIFCLVVCIDGLVVRPTPTAASVGPIAQKVAPTPAPQARHVLAKRGVQATLDLYQDWAKVCNGNDDNDNDNNNNNNNKNNMAAMIATDQSVRMLWQTVTSTVYCGNGHVTTITKTITATTTATATALPDGQLQCNDQCWSDYLWHTYGYGISIAQGFTGIVLILIGLYFLLFGYRFFRPTLALVGFVFFATMTWIGLVNNEPPYGYPHTEIVYICVSIGLGLIGAVIFMFFYPIALYFVGALGGFFLAVFIMSWQVSLVIQIKIARVCFIVGMGVVLAVLVFLIESYTVIFATAFMGAYLFIMGLDLFIHTGFINAFLLIFDGNPYHYNVYILRTPVYVMLAFVMFLTLVSMGWQYYWNIIQLKRYFGINVVQQSSEKGEK